MNQEIIKRILTSIILLFIILFSLFYSSLSLKIILIFFSIFCFYEFYNLLRKIYKINFMFIFINTILAVYLLYFQYIIIKLKNNSEESFILVLLFSCIFSDIGGYVVGKTLGGPKLINISPNKTISGALGSIIFTIIGTYFLIKFFGLLEVKNFYLFIWLFFMSLYCQAGDLFVSFLKRKANVKDTGNLLPGHGGLLDRVDGIILAVPLGILTYFLLFVDK